MSGDHLIVKAPTLQQALMKGASELGVQLQDVSYRVLKKPGIFFQKEYVIKVWKATFLETVLGPSAKNASLETKSSSESVRAVEENLGSDLRSQSRVIVKRNGIFIRLDINKTLTEDMVKALLSRRGVLQMTQAQIPEILQAEPTTFYRISSFMGDLSDMSPLRLEVSEDKLEAMLVMLPPKKSGGPTPTMEEVIEFLKNLGITENIQFDSIKLLVEEEIYDIPILAAKGVAPVSQNTIIYRKYYLPEVPSLENNNTEVHTRVDFRRAGRYRSFKIGDLICERIGKGESRPGVDIFGNPIEPKEGEGEISIIKAGRKVREEGGGRKFYANDDGFVLEEDNIISMSPFLHIKGNVGYATGSISVQGDVIISGDINAGFRVESTGNVTVEGFIQSGIVSTDMDLEVKKGIIGSEIRVKGSLKAYYVEISKLYVLGNIFCAQEISNSRTYCSGYVLLNGSKAYVVGGEMVAKKGLIAKKIGSYLQGISLLIGSDPVVLQIRKQLLKGRENLVTSIGKGELNLERIRKGGLKKASNNKEMEKELVENIQVSKNVLEKIDAELMKIEQYFNAQKKSGFVTVRGTLYAGVSLSMDGLSILFSEKLSNRTIRVQNGRWEVGEVDTASLETQLVNSYKPKKKKV